MKIFDFNTSSEHNKFIYKILLATGIIAIIVLVIRLTNNAFMYRNGQSQSDKKWYKNN